MAHLTAETRAISQEWHIKWEATQAKLTAIEGTIRTALVNLDKYDETEGRDEWLDEVTRDLEHGLKEICKGRWYIKGRSVDGTEYHEDEGWSACWYQATLYDNEAKAQEVIATIRGNQTHLPPDDRVGHIEAAEIQP